MNYPLQLSFKTFAFAPQVSVRDAAGAEVCYIKQELFKFKEHVKVYRDAQMNALLAEMKADSILDFAAAYAFTDAAGKSLGSLKRRGLKSLWKPHYEIYHNQNLIYTIQAESVWTAFCDACFTQIPILGLFSGYVFHPRYLVLDPQGKCCFRLSKQPAFLEGKFKMEQQVDSPHELVVLLSVLMMTLLERQRG
jgi:uncharacterized protein YxjI